MNVSCAHEIPPSPASRVTTAAHRAAKMGLTPNEWLVLAALVESAALIPGEPYTALSRYELAKRIGLLSWSQVQRALSSLASKGLIARRQDAKTAGQPAYTVVSEAAFSLFDMTGGAPIGPAGLPTEFAALIIGESESVVRAIAQAYRDGIPLPVEVEREFRGPGWRLAQIRRMLVERMDQILAETQAAIDALEEERELQDRGIYRLELSNGDIIEFDQRALSAHASQAGSLVQSADIRFARDVLERVDRKRPGLINRRNAPALAAEILFTKQRGFAWKYGWGDACRILASLISKGSWTKPFSMARAWYGLVASAVRPITCSQGVRLRAA